MLVDIPVIVVADHLSGRIDRGCSTVDRLYRIDVDDCSTAVKEGTVIRFYPVATVQIECAEASRAFCILRQKFVIS